METAKFICEFFFGNFWHYLGLWFLCATLAGTRIVEINKHNKE